jgi:hypothetical protein
MGLCYEIMSEHLNQWDLDAEKIHGLFFHFHVELCSVRKLDLGLFFAAHMQDLDQIMLGI